MFHTEEIIRASRAEQARVLGAPRVQALKDEADAAAEAYVNGGLLPDEEQDELFHTAREAHRRYLQAARARYWA